MEAVNQATDFRSTVLEQASFHVYATMFCYEMCPSILFHG